MISLKRIKFRYPATTEPVIKNLSLDIRSGEEITIMGGNGSGKSTLVRLIAGLLKPKSGEIKFSSSHKRRPGFLFQNPDNQMIAMTVAKEVAFALENRAMPDSLMQKKVDEMLSRLGISKLKDRLTNELSGGEKQRVALAASLISEPSVLILDEPDSYLDTEGRLLLRELLATLRIEQPELIIIRVTQFLSVAQASERLILLDRGEIIADGSPVEILNNSVLCEQAALVSSESFQLTDSLIANAPPSSTVQTISLSELSFGYDKSSPILQNVNFQISKEETVFLFGPTGSGKSSIGMLLSGLIKPTGGSFDLFAADGTKIPKLSPGSVSAVFQSPEKQFFLASCAEEITWGPANFGNDLTAKQLAGYLELVRLDSVNFATRDPLSLSVGEKRRLAFAVVLAISPDFIIFDEPTAALDPAGVGWFISLSKKLRQAGIGQLIISHERSLGKALADRAYCVKPDRSLENIGSWAEVKGSELSKFLAE